MSQSEYTSVTVHDSNKVRLRKIASTIASERAKAGRARPVSLDEVIGILLTEHEASAGKAL